MSFKDVIKSSVYQSLGGGTDLSASAILWTLIAAGILGVYIFIVYKCSSKAAFYSKDINITIAGMPVVVAAIMIAMQSNLIVSLGMVGALSIVRFRTAVKNPLDLLYLFWSISAGIICGVGLKVFSILLCIIMTLFILILQMIPISKSPSVLILRSKDEDTDWAKIKESLRPYSTNLKEKSRNYQSGETEIIFELKLKNEEALIKELQKYDKLEQVSLLTHDGEYRV